MHINSQVRGCHGTVNPADNTAQCRAGQLDLTAVPSDEQPLQLRSYRELFFRIMSRKLWEAPLQDRLVRVRPMRTAIRRR